jgi:hypothetical protein
MLHDLHLNNRMPPRRKFNGAQQIAYTAVICMGAGSLLTGLAIYKPVQVAWLTSVLGGYQMARREHFWLTIGYVLFFLVHITQVIRAGWNNARAMVTGYELVPIEGRNMPETDTRLPAPAVSDGDREMARMTRRSFAAGGIAAVLGMGGWAWLRSRATESGVPWPLRRVLEFNERVARALFS